MVGPRTTHTTHTTPTTTPRKKSPFSLIALLCIALLVIIGLAILITWLAMKPKKLHVAIDEGWIKNYNLSNSNELSSNFNFVLRTYNPNRKTSIYFDKIEVTVLYRGQNVAMNTIQPFHQPRRNVTRVLLQNTAHSVALPPSVAHDLKVERTGGEVDLDVKIRAKLRFKIGIWKSRHHTLKALCSPVVVSFSNDSKSQPRDCDVDI